MATDTTKFLVRISASRIVLGKLPRECKNWRDTNLQICALERMVEKFNKRFWMVEVTPVLGGKVSKNKQKELGSAFSALNLQDRKVRDSLHKTLEEGYYKEYPDATVTPKQLRRLLVETHREFEQFLLKATEGFRKSLHSAPPPPDKKGLKA